MVVPKVIIAVLLLCISLGVEGQNASQSEIEGMRLVRADGSIGGNKGRLEVMYDGEWGTVCDDGWSVTGARVACRMLGFEDAICATYHSYPFGSGSYLSPILMDNVMCSGDESHLDFCDFNGWKMHNCGHYEDAGVVCGTSSSLPDFGVPENICLIESSTTSLTIGWTAPEAPNGTSTRYRIIRSTNYRRTYYYYQTADAGEELSYTINHLQRDTVYNISIAMDVGYSECGYSYTYGNSSDDVEFRTNATRKQSNIPVRLVSPGESALNFIGRVEVSYNETWYTVCDDYFGTYEANVICGMLNFTQGALCYVGYGRLGRGTAPILPASIDCDRSDEVLEDCSFTQGRYRYCDHSDDVGVVCRPNTVSDYLPPVENLTVTAAGPDYITLGWNSYTFPSGTYVNKRFNVRYTRDNGYTRSRTVYVYGNSQSAPSYNTYTLRYLSLGDEYNITVRAYIYISGCYSTLYGEYSDSVLATTVEIAPTAPPGEFHVIALNTSSLDVQWGLPAYGKRGGVIRGYKIFVNPANGGQEMTINITNNQTNEYVVNGLQRNTPYQISVLAYTIAGDGPRTIALTVATLNYNPLITQFGFYGNGLDRQQVYTWRYGGVHIFCGTSNVTHAPSDWYFSNGSRIGVKDRHFRVGHYINGTAVLQIAESRYVSYCDGQTYTCVVNTTGHYETRNFTLIVGYSPPAPQTPFIISVQSTTITIGWEESSCHGGHDLASFAFRYYDTSESQTGSYYDYYYYFPYYRNYRYVTNIASDARNYTFTNLKPDTQYAISVKAISLYSTESSYSTETFITTLDPAPSRPRNVSVRLVKPMTVEVRWRIPALPNGNISHYTVYVLPYTSTGDEEVQPLKMFFPSTAYAGNITLADHSITYHFRVSAAIMDDEVFNEGELSSLTQGAILYIPKPEPVTTSVSPPPNPPVSPVPNSGISGATIGEIGGVTVGVLIVILLIVLIVVILLKKRKPNILLFKSFGQHKRMKDEPHIFDGSHLTDTESGKDGSIFDTDESKNITDF